MFGKIAFLKSVAGSSHHSSRERQGDSMTPRFSDYLDKEKRKQLERMGGKQNKERKAKQKQDKPTTEHLSERDILQLMSARSYGRGRGGAIRQRRY
ncbi:hypothetical protein P4S83_17850 [Aneurinibacillus thermoaerophilus]|uniref:hypothetical protein n=1 Tax=Aneurinibacillus thermoaerophilus TaxID=143495 RepID=UPI002E1DA76D|nr:hypothetical protein [Aneurinibacillus thermoaerophilus]MED0765515.1 hypothetical protein [Aneurinibacillus thermoaerophilus]